MKLYSGNARNADPKEVDRIQKEMRIIERAYKLRELRERQDMTQERIASLIGVGQRRVSKIEHGEIEHAQIDTVKRYVEALGGRVEVVAKFGDESYTVVS